MGEQIILVKAGDRFDVTNVGAVLFAQDLSRFDRLARKALRVVFYRGDNRAQTIKEHVGSKGYAIDFENLVANALIHQDFLIRGAGPMVEVFDSRIEISNPGASLVDTLRFRQADDQCHAEGTTGNGPPALLRSIPHHSRRP